MYIKRREFIRLSGITMAGSVFIPPLLQGCKRIPLSNDATGYLNHFEVTADQLQKVILTSMGKGQIMLIFSLNIQLQILQPCRIIR